MLLVFFCAILATAVYLCVHVLGARWLPWPARAALCVLILAASQMHAIQRGLFGSLSGPDMPAWLLKTQAALFCAFILLGLLALCRDAGRLLCWLARRSRPRSRAPSRQAAGPASPGRRRFLQEGMASAAFWTGAPAASLALGACGTACGTAQPSVRETVLAVPELDPALEGLCIVHLADLHIGPLTSRDWVRQLCRDANACRPDLVCLTGDLADGACSYRAAGGGSRREAALELSALQARLGVFACTGNHEYYSGYADWMAVYREAGIRLLHGEAMALDAGRAPLVLAGLDDPAAARILAIPPKPLAEVLAKTPDLPKQAFAVVMDHRPGRAFVNARAGASLQLSGHTHGGQCLGMARIVARANRGLVAGWYRTAGMPLYVTAGAGLWPGFPIRLGVPAEIAAVRLTRAAGKCLQADGKAL